MKQSTKTELWWLLHNVVGHPTMALLHVAQFNVAANWIHDATLPPKYRKRK